MFGTFVKYSIMGRTNLCWRYKLFQEQKPDTKAVVIVIQYACVNNYWLLHSWVKNPQWYAATRERQRRQTNYFYQAKWFHAQQCILIVDIIGRWIRAPPEFAWFESYNTEELSEEHSIIFSENTNKIDTAMKEDVGGDDQQVFFSLWQAYIPLLFMLCFLDQLPDRTACPVIQLARKKN